MAMKTLLSATPAYLKSTAPFLVTHIRRPRSSPGWRWSLRSTAIFSPRLSELYGLKDKCGRLLKQRRGVRLCISKAFLRVLSVVCRPQCFSVWSRLAGNHLRSCEQPISEKQSCIYSAVKCRHIFPLPATDQHCALRGSARKARARLSGIQSRSSILRMSQRISPWLPANTESRSNT